MNVFQKEIKAAFDAFRFWVMPPAVRRYKAPRPGSRAYRYPGPGSEPADHENTYIDYKTAYRDSIHHIRYNTDIHKTLAGTVFIQDPFGETVGEKLMRYGFLKRDQLKDSSAVESARAEYEKIVGESVDVRVHRDDFGYSEQPVSRDNSESVAEYITGLFEGVSAYNNSEAWMNDLDDIYSAHFYVLKTFDMAADDPVYRELTMSLENDLEAIMDNREELKNFPVFKSNPAYWAILDDSFSADNIKKIQASVKNFTGYQDLTPVETAEGDIPTPKGNPASVQVPNRTKFVE